MLLSVYEKEYTVPPSACDWSGRLSVPDTFALFMDTATEHADLLGIGLEDLKKEDLFWLTVRTRVRFAVRPRLGSRVTVSTWPEKPQRLRCNRDYSVVQNGELILSGKTEWAVMNMKTGQLHDVSCIYPEGLLLSEREILPEPFTRIRTDGEGETIGTYPVRSTDIDIGGHMNNTAYIRAFTALISSSEWRSHPVSEMEAHFRAQCFEGDELTFRKTAFGDRTLAEGSLADGRTAIQILYR